MTYEATDDDLPEELFSDKPISEKLKERDSGIAAQVFYPVIKEIKLTRRQERSLKEDREGSREDRRIQIRIGKKRQMYEWLKSIESYQLFGAMDDGEKSFCYKILEKFNKYTVQRTKWITQKQYEWLKFIAAKYLPLPQVKR